MTKKIYKEIMWAIKGVYGFYIGLHFTRSCAVEDHCDALGLSWEQCKKRGDRAVKVEVREI